MPRHVVFLPDSELLIPGRAGAIPVLENLRAKCDSLLAAALAETATESVAVFATHESKFGRPLPGPAVARAFLERNRFAGDIIIVHEGDSGSEEIVDGESIGRARLWLVCGTGAATHGEQAPLVGDERGVRVDAQISTALGEATWPVFDRELIELAHEVGATLVPALDAAARWESDLRTVSKMVVSENFNHQEFGVTYFAARWKHVSESER